MSQVQFEVRPDQNGQLVIAASVKRTEAAEVQKIIDSLLEELVFREKAFDLSSAHFLQTNDGHRFIKNLEEQHHCTINVQTPEQQVLLHALSPHGHQLVLCEGKVATAGVDMIVLPLRDGQEEWPHAHKQILDSGKTVILYFNGIQQNLFEMEALSLSYNLTVLFAFF